MVSASDYLLGNDLRLTALPSSGESGLPAYMQTAIGPIAVEPPVNPKITSTPSNSLWDTLAGAVSTGIQGAAAVGSALWNDWLIGKVSGQQQTLNGTTNTATPSTTSTATPSAPSKLLEWFKQPKNLLVTGGSILALIAGIAAIKRL